MQGSCNTFNGNSSPSLGVELELQLVDAKTMALKSGVSQILDALGTKHAGKVKPELMQSYIEINTDICDSVAAVEKDLSTTLNSVNEIAQSLDTRLFWAGTHPFSPWFEQSITPDERYLKLVETMQDTARRLVSFGMHVHVGVDTGDKAIMIVDRILRYLPPLLSLSANSPFWNGRNTGLRSYRSKIMETLPAAGLPPLMRNWSEYVWVVNHSLQTGFLNSIREIWWDVRPHPNFGTVEVRICDMPPSLEDTLGLTAFIQCLVSKLSDNINEGVYQHDAHPVMVKQNKWKACRYGLEAELIDPTTMKPVKARDLAVQMTKTLLPTADKLGCRKEIEYIFEMANRPSGARRQIDLYKQSGDLRKMIETLVNETPITGNP